MSQTPLIASRLPNSRWPLDACTWLLMNYINYCKSVEFLRQAKSRVYLLPLPPPPPTFLLSPHVAPTVESLTYQNETCKFCVLVCKFAFMEERLGIMADEDCRMCFTLWLGSTTWVITRVRAPSGEGAPPASAASPLPQRPALGGSGSVVSWVLVLSNKNHFFLSFVFNLFVVVAKYGFVITHWFSVSLSTA